ncbi:MAG: putative membrane protein [Rubritalea sp.]|jgi:putative membrane protein
MKSIPKHLIFYLIALTLLFIWSGINPNERFIWFLEVLPAVIGVLLLVVTFKSFRWSNMTYFWIFVHCIILIIGGKYTYADVPVFEWIQEYFEHSGNNYDKLGHFIQGFTPALIVGELLLRKEVVQGTKWLAFIVFSICLSISAAYELIEAIISMLVNDGADSFLGAQGYIWGTQTYMMLALIGALLAVLFLSTSQDTSIQKIKV